MNETFKSQLQIGGAIALAAAGLVGLTNYLIPAPPKPLTVTLEWNPSPDAGVYYEMWSTVNLASNKSWYLKARVTGTNRMTFQTTNQQEFFAVRAALPVVTGPLTNSVTNWIYSEWSVKK